MKTLLPIVFLVFLSCEGIYKTSFLENYNQFIEDLKKNQSSYTEAQWDEAATKFKNFTEVEYPKYKDAMTAEERSKYNALNGKYYGIVAKHKAGEVSRELEDLLNQTKGLLDEMNN